ncbi:MAG: sugar phosphate isomerase/epimerase [Cyclobacteriaceae bacterium]
MTSRRKFIKTGSLAAAGAMIAPMACTTKQKPQEASGQDTPSVAKIVPKDMGMQAYSVRDALKEDFAGSMKKIADIGYKYIEAYGLTLDGKLYGMAPGEYKKIVNDLGMQLISSHSTYFTPEEAPAVIEASQQAGIKYLVIPYLADELRSDYRKVADNLNAVGELFKGSGVKFCYHNHAFEFEATNGEVPLHVMLDNTQPDLVSFEADLYWVKKGGHEPLALIDKYPGRFSLFHVKDAASNLDQTTVGEGIIDFQSIFNVKDKAGLEYYFVEDERTDDPFGNLKKAYDHINTLKI